MPLTAKDLSSSAGTTRLEAVTREIISMVETKLREADRAFGRNVTSIDLNTEFGIPGMTKKNQQLFVYSKVISQLTANGFEVGIELKPAGTTLHVAYTIDFSQEQLKAMYAVLRERILETDEDVREFVRGDEGDAMAPTPAAGAAAN